MISDPIDDGSSSSDFDTDDEAMEFLMGISLGDAAKPNESTKHKKTASTGSVVRHAVAKTVIPPPDTKKTSQLRMEKNVRSTRHEGVSSSEESAEQHNESLSFLTNIDMDGKVEKSEEVTSSDVPDRSTSTPTYVNNSPSLKPHSSDCVQRKEKTKIPKVSHVEQELDRKKMYSSEGMIIMGAQSPKRDRKVISPASMHTSPSLSSVVSPLKTRKTRQGSNADLPTFIKLGSGKETLNNYFSQTHTAFKQSRLLFGNKGCFPFITSSYRPFLNKSRVPHDDSSSSSSSESESDIGIPKPPPKIPSESVATVSESHLGASDGFSDEFILVGLDEIQSKNGWACGYLLGTDRKRKDPRDLLSYKETKSTPSNETSFAVLAPSELEGLAAGQMPIQNRKASIDSQGSDNEQESFRDIFSHEGSSQVDFDFEYDPLLLDDQSLFSEKQKTTLTLPGIKSTILPYITKKQIKQETNKIFKERFPEIAMKGIELSKIRSCKKKLAMLGYSLHLEESTIALSFVLAEKLILKKLVSKIKLPLFFAVCCLLSAKFNELLSSHDFKILLEVFHY
eukprot:TRINITY_DN2037_c2_g1_i1.p1 TRINITY_DN2037_c2_g1~~TRINITY_DN2037_c2_g1_i1.p1  ORF type:complete len:565 (+),score=141.47 TRINITY_DN2037_c2_g1_i1:834-2528(+)